MNKKVSNKIVYLNFILAFLILNLHSAYMELFDQNISRVSWEIHLRMLNWISTRGKECYSQELPVR